MSEQRDGWLLITSTWLEFTLDTGRPIAVNPNLITSVRPLHPGPGSLISFSGDGAIAVVEDFATVMDKLAGKRT